MNITVDAICTINCSRQGCDATVVKRIDVPVRHYSTKEQSLHPTASVPIGPMLDELRREGWAIYESSGVCFCPKHAVSPSLPSIPDADEPLKSLGFSPDVLMALDSYLQVRTVNALLMLNPERVYYALMGYLGLTYEFNVRLAELGITVEGDHFKRPNTSTPFWAAAPETAIDLNQTLSEDEYDALCWEEKLVAWLLTGTGHRFFSWRKERPVDWKESIHYVFDTQTPEKQQTIMDVCTSRKSNKDMTGHEKTVIHSFADYYCPRNKNVLFYGIKKCGLRNPAPSGSDKMPGTPLHDILISTQTLSPRVINILVLHFHLHTLSDVFSRFNDINSLYEVSGIGQKAVDEIIRVMEDHGCRVVDGRFKAPSFYLGDGCVCCPVERCDTFGYRGSRCAELRDRSGLTSDPELDLCRTAGD